MPTNLPPSYRPAAKATPRRRHTPAEAHTLGRRVGAFLIVGILFGCLVVTCQAPTGGPGTARPFCADNGAGGCYWMNETEYAIFKVERANRLQREANQRAAALPFVYVQGQFPAPEVQKVRFSFPAGKGGKDQSHYQDGTHVTWE
jgi:hypothetical protein